MPRRYAPLLVTLTLLGVHQLSRPAQSQTPVLTRSYDDARTGANTQEKVLIPAKVASGMKQLFSLRITDDSRIEAQPLYVPGLKMNDGKTHDVIYVCSMNNTVWAFEAQTGASIWPHPVSLGRAVRGKPQPVTGFPTRTDIDLWGINDHWGILSTPVIDIDTKTMYVVNWSSADGKREHALHRLHALNLADGSERPNSPLTIQAPLPGATSSPAQFLSGEQKQRSALLLVPLRQTGNSPVRKTLFMACGKFGEGPTGPHGWVVAFDVAPLKETAAWCTTPQTGGGGVWQAGQGPAADEQGDVYAMTSNGGWNGLTDFSESFVKLRYSPGTGPSGQGTLTLIDWFTPFKDGPRQTTAAYDFKDQDLGSAGPVVPPGLGLILGAGKDGVLYVFDKNNLGKSFADFSKLKQPPIFFTYFPGGISPTGNLDFNFQGKTHHLHGSPIFWDSPDRGPMLFDWGENEHLRAWTMDATGKVTFLAKSNETASEGLAGLNGLGGMPGGILTLSANGQNSGTGIVWATAPIHGDANKFVVEGILRAYDATTLDTSLNPDGTQRLKLLWDSKRISGNTFKFNKFCPPVVADGKVLVATYDGRVDVYGPR